MASKQRKRKLKRGASGLEKVLDEYKECQWMKSKKLKELLRDLRNKLINTMESYREHDETFCHDVPSVRNILAALYLSSDVDGHVKKAQEINEEILCIFPENIGALFVRVEILIFNDEFNEANQVIETMRDISSRQKPFPSAHEGDMELKEHECLSRVDQGLYLMHKGPAHYPRATELFNDAVSWQCDESQSQGLCYKNRIIWSYLLIKTYNRMMTTIVPKESERHPPGACFDSICSLLPTILKPKELVLPEYQGMAYIELYDAFTKMLNKPDSRYNPVRSVRKAFKLKGGKQFDKEDWLRNAVELAPQNGHVLERLGRHYRVIATNMDKFQVAVDFLEKCVLLFSQRHVAWHQLASCYTSMWHMSEGFPEARLHTNAIRKGFQDKKYGNKKKNLKRVENTGNSPGRKNPGLRKECGQLRNDRRTQNGPRRPYQNHKDSTRCPSTPETDDSPAGEMDVDDDAVPPLAEENAVPPLVEKNAVPCSAKENAVHPLAQVHAVPQLAEEKDSVLEGGSMCSSELENMGAGHAEMKPRASDAKAATEPPQSDPLDLIKDSDAEPQVIPGLKGRDFQANKPVGAGEIPKHFSKPDYFDKLRVSNPVNPARGVLPDYLEKAIECLQNANGIVEHTSMKYLVDLGRLHISAGCNCDSYFEHRSDCVSATNWGEECSCKVKTGQTLSELKDCTEVEHHKNCHISLVKKIFEEKVKHCPYSSDHDNAYYKEQYALFLEKQLQTRDQNLLQPETYQKLSEKIKTVFRESVVYSIQAREKSRVAFYHLRDMLKAIAETGSEEDQAEAKEELALLEIWVANFSRCEQLISDVLQTNPKALYTQWQLVYSFARNKKYCDAFQYMKPLLNSDKIICFLQNEPPFDCPDSPDGISRELCLTVASKSTESYIGSGRPDLCAEVYRCVFRGLLALNKYIFAQHKNPGAEDTELAAEMEMNEEWPDVMILAEEDDPLLQKSLSVLRDFAGLTTCSNEDILPGQSPNQWFGECQAKTILIPSYARNTDLWLTTDDKITFSQKCLPRAVIYKDTAASGDCYKSLPKVHMKHFNDDANDKNDMVWSIFEAILVEYHEYIIGKTCHQCNQPH